MHFLATPHPTQKTVSSRLKRSAAERPSFLPRSFPPRKLPGSPHTHARISARWRSAALLLALVFVSPLLRAQHPEEALSDAEVEQLRESAYVPADRIRVFIDFLDARARRIQEFVAKPRRPGREEDLHDLLEQFTAITEELNDNLDDYGPRHADLRKQLPKLLQATDRWSTALRTPADSDIYNVSRSLALEGVRDVHDEASKLVDEQRAWFAAHPPAKDSGAGGSPHS